MTKKPMRILAIDPGTRETGVAVLEGRELIYWGVKGFKKRGCSPQTLLKNGRRMILRVLEYYEPDVIAIEKTFVGSNKSASLLNVLADEFKALAKKNKLKAYEYAPKTVRKWVCKNGKATKREVAKIIASQYPELTIYISQDRGWKEKYWQNMFDAVAVGLACLDELERLEIPE